MQAFKQARRRDDDIAIVTRWVTCQRHQEPHCVSAMRVVLKNEHDEWKVEEAGIAFGGMAPLTVRQQLAVVVVVSDSFDSATETQKFLVGRLWDTETLQLCMKYLEKVNAA